MEEVIASPDRISDHFAGWCWPQPLTDSTEIWLKSYAYLAASYLTDAACKFREYGWQLEIVKELNPAATSTQLAATRFFLHLGRIACGATAFLALPGMALRGLANYFQHEPYIHLRGTLPEKNLIGNTVSHYFRNLADIAGGYCITDAGVAPWTYRIDGQIEEIKNQRADVLCLCEVADPSAAFYLYEKLKNDYAHFYFNMGMKAVGPGAGLFVASKYAIKDPSYIPFPVETLQGRTKGGSKGYFRFDIESAHQAFIRFYTTHAQHSEEPGFPNRNKEITDITEEVIKQALTQDCLDDVVARAAQIHLITQDIQKNPFNGAVILTGDLNLDDQEREASFWNCHFVQGTLDYADNKTWGGDGFYVGLVNGKTGEKKVSNPLNLDYTLAWKDTVQSLITTLVDTTFEGNKFKPEALSDHSGLRSEIILKRQLQNSCAP